MEDMITGLCPQCGHTLHIPAELASFSCMYCGARLTKEQLAAEPPAAQEADEDRAAYYDRAVSRLGWCIKNFGGYQKKIMRDVFFEAFETYETGCAPVIQELARGVAPEQQTQLLGRAAAAMLDELEAGWQKKGDMEDEKIVLAIFFVPMVRKQQLLKRIRITALRAADQKFVLQSLHPKSRLIPAAMDAISSIVAMPAS